ncbi:hypothetical protein KAI52_02905 [Candidatus Parcubacteria bacterium]|nr:hypothetical protein [Candidatus Parcubacteria bacterium]
MITSWVFSGWPQIFNFPPKVKQIFAATQIKTAGTVSSVKDGGGYSDCDDQAWNEEGASIQADLVSEDASEVYITADQFDNAKKSQTLILSNFSFDLPTNSTIDGIEVSILRRSNGGANGTGKDYHLQLTKTAGTPVASSDDKAAAGTNWPSTLGTETYGGSDDKWSVASWSELEIENSGFGLVLAVEASAANADVWIDQIQITVHYTAPSGTLTVDIVDSGGSSVASPTMAMTGATFSFDYQTGTGTFGVTAQKIRVQNTTANPQWILTITADLGATAFWDGATSDYDFNDPTASAGDGADDDSLGGQMTINASVGTLGGTCSATDVTKESSVSFSEGAANSITLLTAGASADTDCYWDLTGVSISQTIPAGQSIDSYSINMLLTVAAP